MRWRKKRANRQELAAQAKEMLDRYSDRTYIGEPSSTSVVMEPGKMLDKLRERMEQMVLDPLNIDVAVEDFLSADEVMMLVASGFGGLLVGVTAEHAADLLNREFPPDLASRPIVSYDVRQLGVDVTDEIQTIGRDILNSQTSQSPRRDLDQVDEQVREFDDDDQVGVYIAVLMLYLRKLSLLREMSSNS